MSKLKLLLVDDPEPVLLDARAWDGAGPQCCRLIERATGPTIPVVLISPREDYSRCLKSGADACLLRVYSRGQLLGSLSTFTPWKLRSGERWTASLRVAWLHGERDGLGYTRDLGPGEFYLRTAEPFEPGQAMQLVFELPTTERPTILAEGEVVRRDRTEQQQGPAGVGLRFRKVGERDLEAVERFVGRGP